MMRANNGSHQQSIKRSMVRYGWPVLLVLLILWFPFDWLSTVWPAFGVPFRRVFRTAHDHFIGHTIFFLIVGFLILTYLPRLRRRPLWYLLGLMLAALIQETIQALFRGQVPTYTDTNAFTGDALGGTGALFAWWGILRLRAARKKRPSAQSTTLLGVLPNQEQK
jgi:hypothetical protein